VTSPFDLSVVVAVGKRQARVHGGWLDEWVAFAQSSSSAEVLLVHGNLMGMPEESDNLRIVACDEGATIPQLRLQGLQAASASRVILTEGFGRPGPGLLAGHSALEGRGPVDPASGSVMRASGSASHWALTMVEFGRLLEREPSEVQLPPLVNASFNRQALLALLEVHSAELIQPQLQATLLTAGESFRSTGSVLIDDNRLSLREACRDLYHQGRLVGGQRMQDKGLPLRLVWMLGATLVPALLGWRIVRASAAAGLLGQLLRSSVHVKCMLLTIGIGEGMGALMGPGKSGERWS
jgi:hypothetical protein